ncbi:MAG: ArsR/SmtB family transcription factor [Haloarculaceae archaeon]
MSLLPSEPDTTAAEEAAPRVIGVDSEDADDVFAALTAETARDILTALHDEPAPPAAIANRVDTSLQNAQYHLQKLEDAGAIEVIDTAYSEKGREMDVYAPADRPLVIFAGDEEQSSGLRAALSRLLGGVGVLALASLAVQAVFGRGGPFGGSGGGDRPAAGAGPAATNGTATPTAAPSTPGSFSVSQHGTTTGQATESAAHTTDAAGQAAHTTTAAAHSAADAALSLPLGLVFFLGGATALAIVAGIWYLSE